MVLFPEATQSATKNRAEHLLEMVSQAAFPFKNELSEPVTLSAGVSVYPEDGEAAEEIIKAADFALYKAKEAGRNRVFAANEITPTLF